MKTSIHDEGELWANSAATGGLSETELTEWNDHIATCPECKRLNEEEMAMCALIESTLDAESPDPGFEQRIINRLDQARAGERNRWDEFVFVHPGLFGAVAGLALAGIAGIGLLIHAEKQGAASSGVEASLNGLPAAVRSAVESQTDVKTVSDIERNDDDNEVSYTIGTKTRDGGESSFTVAEDGSLLSVDTTLAEAPEAVRDAITSQVGRDKLEEIAEDFDAGETNYTATVATQDGNERDLTFAKDGTLLDVEMSLAEAPAAVQAAVKAQMGQGKLEGLDKTFDDGETEYTATISAAGGRERDYTYEKDGTLSSMEVTRDEVPGPVQAAIKTEAGQGKLEGIDKDFDDGEVSYEASVTDPDGKEHDVSISEEGKLMSREVTMNDAPKAVQETISQRVGNGKVVEIDETFTEPGHIIPYEIEGWKDGKPFYFLVSPTGGFLGMED
jgi:hypothetical protein